VRINLDSDGVIYDMQGELIKHAWRKDGIHRDQPQVWNLAKAWGVSDEYIAELFSMSGIFEDGAPYPGAVEAVNTLVGAGHDVRIVTHKHIASVHDPMDECLHFYHRMGLLDKVDMVFTRGDKTSYPADLVVDDRPNLAWVQGEAVNVLMDRPWNQDIRVGNFPEIVDIKRALGWQDVLEVAEQMGGGVLIDKSPIVI
jgi:hypothetical protein